ncbi:MAG: electron transfer flavoprotein subunit beta [Legionellales bacterium RIFCSPHIGHO2_12_FULL_37_14]|nr:MAG: electron transfer flavoprotein subunit beta [Legionellales bacterium RIFCSPHIGHO2_12_FULL_37_14]
MKVLVPVKRVIDPYVKIRVNQDLSGVQTEQVKMAMNPFDEIALEEAIRLKEKKLVDEIIIISIGESKSQETLRHGLALGADRAILIDTENKPNLCSLNIAKILQKIVQDESIEFVLMGKQAIDGDNNQTPQMLASLLDWPQATYASLLKINGKKLEITREVDAGLEVINADFPIVISVDLRLNTPRYASLPNIMQAKNKPLAIKKLAFLGLSLKEHIQIVKVEPPAQRKGGEILNSVDELVHKLKSVDKII